MALALLETQGRLDTVPDHAWASWAGTLVWFPAVPIGTADRDRKARLLAHAARHAAAALAQAIDTYLRRELAGGRLASEIEVIDPCWHPAITDTWVALLEALSNALQEVTGPPAAAGTLSEDASLADRDVAAGTHFEPTITLASTNDGHLHALRRWESMVFALFTAGDPRAAEIARRALQGNPQAERARLLAARAACVLTRTDTATYWPEIRAVAEHDAYLGRSIALALAASQTETDILANLDEDHLADVYRWVSGLFPPEEHLHKPGFYFVSEEEETHRWRDRILQQLAGRGTERAVTTLASLSGEYPDRLLIASSLQRARMNVFASAWIPPKPDELGRLLEDSRRRIVRSERELSDLLLEVLAVVEEQLPSHGESLWDRLPKHVLPDESQLSEAWLPKREAALSAYIAHELSNRLDRRGLAVNREVLVLPTDAYGAGDRTDILVEATVRDDPTRGSTPARLAVVVEVKGPWNETVRSAERDQLAQRYLPEAHTRTGIYLVGWYPPDQWTDRNDYRRSRVTGLDRTQLAAELKAQANAIRAELGMEVTPILLTAPRPHKPTIEDGEGGRPGVGTITL